MFYGISTIVGCPRGVMVKAMDCGIVVREFVLQSRYYVHFRANTLGKRMNPLILPAMGKIVKKEGARGVMVIVVGNGHGDTSSNPGQD